MGEFDQLYRELILDHYKSPRNHGLLEDADATAEGQNPLCGDEVTVSVRFGEGDVVEEVGFEGRGCAISQAATSMLTDLVKGKTAAEIAAMPKEELLGELGIPLTPGAPEVRDPRPRGPEARAEQGEGHAAPGRVGHVGSRPRPRVGRVPEIEVCPLDELGPGKMRLVPAGSLTVGVFNCGGSLYAIEDRCSHDDGPLAEGDWDPEACVVVCPRHGSRFDLETGIPMSLPAFVAVRTFPVSVRDGVVLVDVEE